MSLSIKEQNVVQKNDTFCSTMLMLINDYKVSLDKYFISDDGLLHKVIREDNKLFHVLMVPVNFCKYCCIMQLCYKGKIQQFELPNNC